MAIILVVAGLMTAACIALAAWSFGRPAAALPFKPAPAVAATFVGRGACAACHQAEVEQWTGSHHDLAMQKATRATVLGDFNNASFTHHDVTSTFFVRDDGFHVRTDGPDGVLHDYTAAYTFGVYPLQQYLIEFPGGRLQALNVCWDARPRESGGQRWFHLYPNETVDSRDILHWTGPYQNWNHMCAECHSTNVHKNYDAASDTFKTSWSELDVSCEACHGPASEHVAWAKRAPNGRNKSDGAAATLGLAARLREDAPGVWIPDAKTGIARRDVARTSWAEVNTCARCHSRRGTFNEDVVPGRPPADTHRLALLEAALYEADGQIKDEDYEYGSFLQSRMYAAGVTCTDCHNPHTLRIAPGNAACARCHSPERFDTPAHHFHAPGAKGSACVECHMPTRTYMVVHERHDHSIRVPRPDLTVSIGTPNACNTCHADRSAQWAAEEIARRTPGKGRKAHFGEAIAAGRGGQPGSEALLAQLLADVSQPGIARATAAEMLGGSGAASPLAAALGDADPIVRSAAVRGVGGGNAEDVIRRLEPLLSDPVRQVRIDAARRLAGVPETSVSPERRAALGLAMAEYMASLALDADRAESHLNLGALHVERGDAPAAEQEYLIALRLSPRFPATYVNLADLYRQTGREDEAVRVLREGAAKAPDNADIAHALGLALVRGHQVPAALPLLERAAKLAPEVTRYAYVYAVALQSTGSTDRAIDVLEKALESRPNDRDILAALAGYCDGLGRLDKAMRYASRLAALYPNDPQARDVLRGLEAKRAGRR